MSERELSPADILFIPRRGRLLHEETVGPDGGRVLTLFYDEKEITFDDPALIPFGERLVVENRFSAEGALGWCADGYEWETVKELFEALMEEGFLEVEDAASAFPAQGFERNEHIIGSGTNEGARAWSTETCLGLSTEIFGGPVEIGNLESLLRCVRIAHPALDVGGRQVGERNVFPAALMLDLPTKVRGCPYRGSRFEHELPMNVAGLDPVVKGWRGVLHDVRALKNEFFRRRPAARAGLSIVDIYVLGTIALSVPAFLMLRADDTVANGELPLEVSAFFRVMDGTRMTPRDMLTVAHPAFGPDVIPTAEKFFHYADREQLLITEQGVCAGPPQMIETFLELVLSVDPSETGDAPLRPETRIGDLVRATNYGLAGGELEAISDQFWLRHRMIVDRLNAHLAGRQEKSPLEQALQARFELSVDPVSLSYLFLREEVSIEAVHGNFSRIIERCHEMRALPGKPDIAPFADGVDIGAPEVLAAHAVLRRDVPELSDETRLELAFAAIRLQRIEEQMFPRMAARQAEVNTILGRPQPSRAFDEHDLAKAWPLVSLRTMLAEEAGIVVGGRGDHALTVGARNPRPIPA